MNLKINSNLLRPDLNDPTVLADIEAVDQMIDLGMFLFLFL